MTKSIERLVEEADGVGTVSIYEACGLLTEDMLLEMVVQEGVGDIQLLGCLAS